MILDTPLTWLGFRTRKPVAGLHITDECMTLAVLRPDPCRLVALGRRPVADDAVVDDQVRLIEPLTAELRRLAAHIRLPSATPVVTAVEPLVLATTIYGDGPTEPSYDVHRSTYAAVGQILTGAALKPARVDIVPAALARYALQIGSPNVALRSPTGWTVVSGDGFTDAERIDPRSRSDRLEIGPDLASLGPIGDLAGIDVPAALRDVVDPDRDAVAVGAALAALGRGPQVTARPAEEPVGSGWIAQPVTGIDR